MELSKLQKQIIESKAEQVVVIASAACGKTHTLTERVRFWLNQGVDPAQICAITFTNAAANEMQVRLGADYKDGMFIGTIHALAARFLVMAGYGDQIGKAIDEENFDLFFTFIQKYPDCVQHYTHVLVDEAQDLAINDYDFIFRMINPENFFVVGDYRQNIYESLKGASSKYILALAQRPGVVKYDLNENYRNKANILQRAKQALRPINMSDNSLSMSIGGTVYEGTYDIDNLLDWIENVDTFKDWAILCYNNEDVSFIMKELARFDIPSVNFNQRQKTKKELDALVNTNKVKVLTVWGAKGLGFPNVVVYGTNWMKKKREPEKKCEGARVDYVAYTRAMNSLMILTPPKKNKGKWF